MPTPPPPTIVAEMVLEEPDGMIVARNTGVDRIELCANLAEGGTTPTLGTMEEVLSMSEGRVAIACMIRQRGGEFVYTSAEFSSMLRDTERIARIAQETGVAIDLVTGILTPDGEIDEARTGALIEAASGLKVAVHHAFDETRDLERSLDTLMELGVVRVLTSGGFRRLEDGADMLGRLVRQSERRIEIMSGGEVDLVRYPRLLAETGVRHVHFGSRGVRPSLSRWSNPEMSYDTGGRLVAEAERVSEFLAAVRGHGRLTPSATASVHRWCRERSAPS